ncbi:hypothetical protein Pelo_14485 [Pelomyxa schiedti]|nr:hypothetical protein Pelo_14485 [Pelomyxa schiedti]
MKNLPRRLTNQQVYVACAKCYVLAKTLLFDQVLAEAKTCPLARIYSELARIKTCLDSDMTHHEYLASVVYTGPSKPGKKPTDLSSVCEEAARHQSAVINEIRQLEGLVKQITSLSGLSPTQEKVRTNLRSDCVSYLQKVTSQFQNVMTNFQRTELTALSDVYIVLVRCIMEGKENDEFDACYRKKMIGALEIVRRDLQTMVFEHGLNWADHKASIDNRITHWDTTQPPLLTKDRKSLGEDFDFSGYKGKMMRKCKEVLMSSLANLNAQSERDKLLHTKEALAGLIDDMSMSYKSRT